MRVGLELLARGAPLCPVGHLPREGEMRTGTGGRLAQLWPANTKSTPALIRGDL
jgi:hypothetical protein